MPAADFFLTGILCGCNQVIALECKALDMVIESDC